jgi:hypothetical protein
MAAHLIDILGTRFFDLLNGPVERTYSWCMLILVIAESSITMRSDSHKVIFLVAASQPEFCG